MNKNSTRDVIIYYAHDLLGYTAIELAKIYGIGAPRIRQIIQRVRRVDNGETIHGPTSYALKQMRMRCPARNWEVIKLLRKFASKLDKEIDSYMSSLIAYAPEIQDSGLLDGIYCISDNLENWQDELDRAVEHLLRSNLAD